MISENKRIAFQALIDRELNGETSKVEKEILETYYQLFDFGPDALDHISHSDLERLEFKMKSRIYDGIGNPKVTAKKNHPYLVKILSLAAASIAVVIGVWFFQSGHKSKNVKVMVDSYAEINPGKTGATITLSTGKVIRLNDQHSGVMIGGKSISYNDGTAIDSAPLSSSLILTASTVNGQAYVLKLSDGTKVWLNAASKLIFPSVFPADSSRSVELSGEAYFEVAKDKSRPFLVRSKFNNNLSAQEIKVLGTHFNVSAYQDDPKLMTTLVEGSVSVSMLSLSQGKNHKNILSAMTIIKPNEQSVLNENGNLIVHSVDTELALAWKNNDFYFKEEPMESVMRKISRWYNIEVDYTNDELKHVPINGLISRTRAISVVLDRLGAAGRMQFKLSGRKVTVMKI